MKNLLLGIKIDNTRKTSILEKIKKYINHPVGFFHIVSLNPENLVIAQENKEFKKVLETAQIKLIDGVGIVLAAQILSLPIGERLTGVELAGNLLNMAGKMSLRVLLIGGGPNLAERLAKCYQARLTQAKFLGIEGMADIRNPQKKEEEKIFSIVAQFKPHVILVAFGSPFQELWLARHSGKLKGVVAMGVGGAFDYLTGAVPRAPLLWQKIGLEWLFRLIRQPWRWRRQLRLVKFVWLILLAFTDKLIFMRFFSLKTIFEVFAGIWLNLTSAWFGALLVYPGIFKISSFEEYRRVLTANGLFGILGLLITLWLAEKSKKL